MLEEAQERFDNKEPPTEDCMQSWETVQNLERQKQTYFQKRTREVNEKKEVLGEMKHRRKPEERPSQYIDSKTGLPLAYGKNAPFKYSAVPANLRHYKNPKVKINEAQMKEAEINTVEL